MRINEVDPRNYDSDIDYYNALRAKPKRAQEPDDLPEPVRPYTDKDAEDDISQQRQRADAKFRQKRKVEYVDQEGSAPNGQRHNKLYVIDAQDEATARHEEYLFDKHEWGAKKVVDTKLEKNTDGTVRLTLYIVDNHKYGFWRPWKDSPVYKEGVAEAGPFNYGAKKTRTGSIADLAAQKRKEQERGRKPVEPKDQMVGNAKVTTTTCPSCHSADVKTYSDGEKECNHCHKTWDVQGVAEGTQTIGREILGMLRQVNRQGHDAMEELYSSSPLLAQYWDEYEGDFRSMVIELPPETLNRIKAEIAAFNQQGVAEATDNPTDIICTDVPLFIRLMEYAREDASSDMDLHDVAERLTKLSAGGETVSMSSYDEIVGAQTEIKEAGMDLEQGRKNIISILKASEQGQDAEIVVGGEPITLEYPEARFVGGRYKAFLKAGRQEEFLRALTNPQAFDRIMAKLRTMIDKQKNFRGSVPGERGVEEGSLHNPGQEDSPVAGAITRRILMQRTDLLAKYGPEKVGQAVDSVADFVGDVDEIGSSDVSGWVKQVERELGGVAETTVNEAGNVKGAVLDCFKQILAGAKAGNDMIDYLADELNDYYKPVRASRDLQLQKAYQYMMDNGADAEGDPEAMAQVAQQAISMLSSVPEAAPGLVKAAGGLALGGIAAAGAPAIVGILGPLLGIPLAAYGAYSAAKLGIQGVEKLWDMAAEKLGGDDKVAQYTQDKIAKLPPEQKQAASQVVKAVSESRQRKNPALAENQYWCNLDKQVKPIPEGYRKNNDGYLVRK